jgi:cell division protein FtsX
MVPYFILSGLTLFGLFILFLVMSKTMNNIVNQLLKIEYALQKEVEFKKEEKEIKRIIKKNLAMQTSSKPKEDEEESLE